MNLITYYPLRSPIALVEAVKDIIQDKIVCDIGCGEGDILWLMKTYAKDVIGFEIDKNRYIHARNRGLKIIVGDYYKDTLPKADIYYCWSNLPHDIPVIISSLLKETSHKKLLVGGRKNADHLNFCLEKYGGIIKDFYFKEPDRKEFPDFPFEGLWSIYILEL